MFTFLSGEYRKEALRGYRARLALVYLGVAAAACFAASALLLPAYFLIAAKKNAYLIGAADVKDDTKAVETEVRSVKEKLSYAKMDADATAISSVLERISQNREAGISITSISLKRATEKGAITIGGKAATRDALVAFSKKLQGEPSFASVDLPVSSLAKSKDISFSISIDSKF